MTDKSASGSYHPKEGMSFSKLLLGFISGRLMGQGIFISEGQVLEVGRAKDLDVVLSEDLVSRRHAKIKLNRG